MKRLLLFLLLFPLVVTAQNEPGSVQFWNKLKDHCGKSYEGIIVEGGKEGDGFTGEKLVMHIRECGDNEIRIPFHVGDNHSRTWILTMDENHIITLKHDHRNADGSEEKINFYGGVSTNTALDFVQFFPADQNTCDMLPMSSTNVWFFTIEEDSISYSLRRMRNNKLFSVRFDTSKEVETPPAPWGSE